LAIPAFQIREEPTERRGEDRWRVRIGARWLDSGPAAQSLTIVDLSFSALLLETDQPLVTGSYLNVEMPGEVIEICKTIWNSGRLYGAAFSEPLADDELQDLINPCSVVWPPFGGETRMASSQEPAQSSSEKFDDARFDDVEKLPVAIRLMILVGTSAASWALIGVCIWLIFR
jgi:hypothetical protein